MNVIQGDIPEGWEAIQKEGSKFLKVLEPLNVNIGAEASPFFCLDNVVIFYPLNSFGKEIDRTTCKVFDTYHETYYKYKDKYYHYISPKVYWSHGWFVKHLLIERDPNREQMI